MGAREDSTVATGSGQNRIVTASLSDVGQVRSENQDACAEFRKPGGERLLIVADGIGGQRGGATASRLCVEEVGKAFSEGVDPPELRLRLGFQRANQQVRAAASRHLELEGMGTTAVALLVPPRPEAWVAWVGDSRAYRFRKGEMELLTQDHSLVSEWVRLGVIDPDVAEAHPQRHQLMRAIGIEQTIEVDIRRIDVQAGDRLLLCSDGLSGYLSDAEIAAVLGFETPSTAVCKLMERVKQERGAPDNVTVQILSIPEQSEGDGDRALQPKGVSRRGGARERWLRRARWRGVGVIGAMLALAAAGYYAVRVGGGGIPTAEERRRAQAEGSGAMAQGATQERDIAPQGAGPGLHDAGDR